MENTSELNLRPIWDAILEVYKVFAAICEKNDLRYCADAGTALGAVRHGGFIPWDDDMDIQMPRSDYEKFVAIAHKELPFGYAWVDKSNCENFDAAYGKVIVTNAKIVEKVEYESGMALGKGIFIDIFPLDGYPDSCSGILWRHFQNNFVRVLCTASCGWSQVLTIKAKFAWLLGRLISPFLPKFLQMRNDRDRVNFYENRAKKIPFGATKLCVSVGASNYNDDKPFPVKCFGVPKTVPFDRVTMKIQEDADGYLKRYFGDYMTLPPKDLRKPSHVSDKTCSWRFGPTRGGIVEV